MWKAEKQHVLFEKLDKLACLYVLYSTLCHLKFFSMIIDQYEANG